MTNKIKSDSAVYSWLCFLISFTLYFCYYRAPFIKEGALFASKHTDAALYAVSLFLAGWVLDRKPDLRQKLPVISAGVCALSAIGMGLTEGIALDLFILLFHLSFAPMFVNSLFHLKRTSPRHLIVSMVMIFILETLFWVLLGDFWFRKLAIGLLAIMAGVLMLLMRYLSSREDPVYDLEPIYGKLRQFSWLIGLFLFQAIYLVQVSSLFWSKLRVENAIINGLPYRVIISLLFVLYGLLMDRKGYRSVILTCSGIVAVSQILLLVPTSPELIQTLLPLSDIGAVGFDLLVLTAPLVIFQGQVGYRLSILGFGLYQMIYGLPRFLPAHWLTTTLGRGTTALSILSTLVLVGAILLIMHQNEKRKEGERSKALAESLAQGFAEQNRPDYGLLGFSRREIEVAELLLQAKTRDEVGATLGLSRGTVNTYCSSLYKKTGSTSQAEFISKLTLQKNNPDAIGGKLLN